MKPDSPAAMLPLDDELLLSAAPNPSARAHHPLLVEADRQGDWPGRFLLSSRYGFATMSQGRACAAGGIIPCWPGRGIAWVTLTQSSTSRVVGHVAYWLQHFMDIAQADRRWSRIEMTLRADLPWCDEFARLTGMTCETILCAYDTLGRDYKLFARIGGPPSPSKAVLN